MIVVLDKIASRIRLNIQILLKELRRIVNCRIWIGDFLLDSKVIDKNCQVSVVAVSDHRNDSMRVKTIVVLQDLSYDARLTCSITLDNFDCFTELEALSNLESSSLDLEWLSIISHEGDVPIKNVRNKALARLELAIDNFDSVANLNLQLRIVSDCPKESFVVKDVPFVLVIILVLKVILCC